MDPNCPEREQPKKYLDFIVEHPAIHKSTPKAKCPLHCGKELTMEEIDKHLAECPKVNKYFEQFDANASQQDP